MTIDNPGGCEHLRFPIMQRPILNVGSDVPEEQVHAALVRSLRKGALVDTPGKSHPRESTLTFLGRQNKPQFLSEIGFPPLAGIAVHVAVQRRKSETTPDFMMPEPPCGRTWRTPPRRAASQ